MDVLTNKFLPFLSQIGIKYSFKDMESDGFLPGLKLINGTLEIDLNKLQNPGDVIHEAGHLACASPNIRKHMSGTLDHNDENMRGELMAMSWSYAVCIFLKIDPYIVFHENGYMGTAKSIVEGGCKMGVSLLQQSGMCLSSNSSQGGQKYFPNMIRWTKE